MADNSNELWDVKEPQGNFSVKSADGKWCLQWEDIGEGYDGDFDPSDPKDRPLWRATLVDKNGEQLDDGSYCTMAVVGVSTRDDLREMAEDLFSHLAHGEGVKRVMQEWTWRTDTKEGS